MGLFSSLFGSGSKSAYDTRGVAAATNAENQRTQAVYDQMMAAGQPYTQLGAQGTTALSSQLPQLTERFTLDQFNTDPSYQFLQDEAAKAVERSAAARGSLLAPSTAKALQDRSQALASTEFGNAFNRNMAQNASIFDMLSGASNVGQNQLAQDSVNSWNYADTMANNNIGLANAQLAAYGAKNANRQSMLSNWINAGARVAGAAASDIRVKQDIKPLGQENGYNIYEFAYKGEPEKRYVGVMAQEVAKTNPDAVVDIDGVLHVYYDKIGVQMREAA
jgi:hypothetical protein